MKRVGLARALSKQGYCSRSRACDLIRKGRVKLNGSIQRDPKAAVRMERDRIEVDDRELGTEAKVYLMLNKPRGVITSAADEKGRKTVYAFVEPGLPWIAPVGRLDKASEGLLLLTNDSEWAARVSAPETHLDKTYHVQVKAVVDDRLLDQITRGVMAGEGERLRVKEARMLRAGEKNSWLKIVLDEGRNRQIRRIFAALGIQVLRLLRISIGPLTLGILPKGCSRSLTRAERESLNAAINKAAAKKV